MIIVLRAKFQIRKFAISCFFRRKRRVYLKACRSLLLLRKEKWELAPGDSKTEDAAISIGTIKKGNTTNFITCSCFRRLRRVDFRALRICRLLRTEEERAPPRGTSNAKVDLPPWYPRMLSDSCKGRGEVLTFRGQWFACTASIRKEANKRITHEGTKMSALGFFIMVAIAIVGNNNRLPLLGRLCTFPEPSCRFGVCLKT